MSIPAMREIRRIFPGAHISLLIKPWVKDVYGAVDFIDELIEFDKEGQHRGWRGLLRMSQGLRTRQFDLAILLQNAFEAALLAWLARIPRRVGYARDGRRLLLTHPVRIDPEVLNVHQAYYYLGVLSGSGLFGERIWHNQDYRLRSDIGVREADRIAAREMLGSKGIAGDDLLIGLNPGAAFGSAKRWFTDRYAEVAERLSRKYQARILLLGSRAERSIADDIARQMSISPVNLAGETTLGELIGLLNECHLFITNDSGPMHLAAALEVPQLAIFGSTSEIATGPLSPQAEVIKNPVDCNPCFVRECPVDFKCMTGISVERVTDAAEKLIERVRGAKKFGS